jgi:nucleotidyltransferase substrate binding protein (TIGR01987 family)
MENQEDIRWKQRFSNFEKALSQLTKFIEHGKLNEFEEQGLIQCFEYSHELAWNVMKDFLTEDGIKDIFGSKSATKQAFNKGLIENGELWMDMIESRNKSVHTYNEDTAEEVVKKITHDYYALFVDFQQKMKSLL